MVVSVCVFVCLFHYCVPLSVFFLFFTMPWEMLHIKLLEMENTIKIK